jgi:hypothetical protein
MDEMICPCCGKMVLSIIKMKSLLRDTLSKTLLGNCVCGEAFRIRSPAGNVFEISTSSGRRLKLIEEGGARTS